MADKVEPVSDNDDWNYVPEGWDSNKWKQGDCNITWLPEFIIDKSFLTDIPDDADEFFFFAFSESGCFTKPCKWILLKSMAVFIALTIYFGIVKKQNLKSYWTKN